MCEPVLGILRWAKRKRAPFYPPSQIQLPPKSLNIRYKLKCFSYQVVQLMMEPSAKDSRMALGYQLSNIGDHDNVQNENLYSKNLSAGSYKVISQHQRRPKSEKICPYLDQTCCFLPICQNPSIPVKSLPNKSHSSSKNICYKLLCKVLQAHNSTSEGCKVEKDLPRYCSSTRFFAFLSESVDTCEKLTY